MNEKNNIMPQESLDVDGPDNHMEITCTTENMALINNAYGCTDLGCMAIEGNTAYCIKTNGDNSLAAFYKVKNYRTYTPDKAVSATNYTTKKITGLYHANGMAYYNKKLYVAGYTQSVHNVFRLSLDGTVEVIYKMPCQVSAITRYKNESFIVRADTYLKTDKAGKKYYCFLIGKFKETSSGKGTFVEESRFYALCGPYTVNQDITYAKNHLLVPTVEKKSLLKNNILVYYIGKAEEFSAIEKDTEKEFKYYTYNTVLEINKTEKNNYKKYEIESPQLVKDEIICVANIEQTIDPLSADGFQLINGFSIVDSPKNGTQM